jgi:hypothetical protein
MRNWNPTIFNYKRDNLHLLFDGRKEMSPFSDDSLTVTIPLQ